MAKAIPIESLPRETVREALEYISENLREADRAELRASSIGDPEELISAGVEASSQCWLILDRTGLPIGVMGVAPSGAPGVGLPWMLGTDGVLREGHSIGRQTRHYVDLMQAEYPVLTNFIDARNEVSLAWLYRAGFHLIDADPAYGPEERLFFQFSRTR